MSEKISKIDHAYQLLVQVDGVDKVADVMSEKGWPSEFVYLGTFSRPSVRETLGTIIGVERHGTLPEFSQSMDMQGTFVWIWQRYDDPNLITVVSLAKPKYIDLSSDGWKEELVDAVSDACENPGQFIDFEHANRENRFVYPREMNPATSG